MNKTLITGSTSGIGKQIGLDLLKQGKYVIFVGYSLKSITRLRAELKRKKFKNYEIVRTDFTNLDEVSALTKYIKQNFYVINNIICNVGITDRASFGDISWFNWNKVLNTNLSYQFFMIQDLKNNILRNGKIIFIGSVSGHIPDATSIAYGVSKGAIETLTKYLAKEFGSKKITVNTIAPGYTLTKWHRNKSKAQMKRISNKTISKRFANVKEISSLCMSILENDYINGQTISIDGGFGLC